MMYTLLHALHNAHLVNICTQRMMLSAQAKAQSKKAEKAVAKSRAWNRGVRRTVNDSQQCFIPREHLALWKVGFRKLCLCPFSGRRISETLRLRGDDLRLSGGVDADEPHIIFRARADEQKLPGLGKLRCGEAVASLGKASIDTMKRLQSEGLTWNSLHVLKEYKDKHPDTFEKYKHPLNRKDYVMPTSDALLFPKLRADAKTPWMSRQCVHNAVDRSRAIMYAFTGKRRYNPEKKFAGKRVCTHGATRHSSVALLLYNADAAQQGVQPPREHVCLQVQQRSDVQVLRQHYYHVHEERAES
eukprot:2159627-Amphidinium_carterae.4